MISLIKQKVNNISKIDLSRLKNFCIVHDYYLLGEEGEEPYKLYAFLSSEYNNITILDIGSYYGNSALALSYNETNTVISYDLLNVGQFNINKNNIHWKLKDFRNDDIDFKNVKIILIDVDPHNGIKEKEMVEYLKSKKWVGILILDDIHLNKKMKELWNSFPKETKEDVTLVGHYTGTGVIYFS